MIEKIKYRLGAGLKSLKSFLVIGLIGIFLSPTAARAEPLKDFLVSCVYGTAAGGLVGVASLAFTDDPGSKMNNIARGASLGLYAGIGFGLYLVYGNPNATNAALDVKPKSPLRSPLWLQPQWSRGQIDGGQLHLAVFNF